MDIATIATVALWVVTVASGAGYMRAVVKRVQEDVETIQEQLDKHEAEDNKVHQDFASVKADMAWVKQLLERIDRKLEG